MGSGKHIEVLLEFGNLWLRDDSVVQVHINDGVHMRTREAQKLMETIGNLSHYTSRPVVVDLRHIEEIDTTAKIYLLSQSENIPHQCLAMVIESSWGRMLANFSLLFRPSGCPTRYFNSDEAALKWSKRYLSTEQGSFGQLAA